MGKLQKAKETVTDIGQLVKACIGLPLALTAIPVGVYCTVRDVLDRVKFHNYNNELYPYKPSPNTRDFPDGPKNRLEAVEKFYNRYVFDVFFKQ